MSETTNSARKVESPSTFRLATKARHAWDSTVIFRLFLCQKQLILLGKARDSGFDGPCLSSANGLVFRRGEGETLWGFPNYVGKALFCVLWRYKQLPPPSFDNNHKVSEFSFILAIAFGEWLTVTSKPQHLVFFFKSCCMIVISTFILRIVNLKWLQT